MDIQDQAQDLGQAIDNELPEAFGGIWFDNADRRVKIGLTPGTSTAPADTLLERRGLQDDADIVTVDASQADLQQAQPDIDDALADLIDDGIVSTGQRVSTNSIEIHVASSATTDQRNRIADVAANAPVPVTVSDSSQASLDLQPAACEFPHCDRPLRGGVYIESTNATSHARYPQCTAGFIARSRSDRKPYVMTAGHCFDDFDDDDSSWAAATPNPGGDPTAS
jgi:streptogrisin C